MEFFGYHVSDKGIKPLIKDCLIDMPKPLDKAEVRSYVGMVNFISRFIPLLYIVFIAFEYIKIRFRGINISERTPNGYKKNDYIKKGSILVLTERQKHSVKKMRWRGAK